MIVSRGSDEIVAQSTPEDIVKAKRSYTGEFFKPALKRKIAPKWKKGMEAAE